MRSTFATIPNHALNCNAILSVNLNYDQISLFKQIGQHMDTILSSRASWSPIIRSSGDNTENLPAIRKVKVPQ